jgi:hypothetical protein
MAELSKGEFDGEETEVQFGVVRPGGRAADERVRDDVPKPGGETGLSAGHLNHLVHGNPPVPSNDVIRRLSDALEVEPEFFREFRLRAITDQLEAMPELVDRLYKRYSA